MKWFSTILALLLVVGQARADESDQYASIYGIIEQADALNSMDKSSQALAKYIEAYTALTRFQQSNPTWNPEIIRFRMSDVAAKIATLSSKIPIADGSKTLPVAPPRAAVATVASQPVNPAVLADWENQVRVLKDQLGQLQGEKVNLEAKLKEALAVQPAEVDPHELAKAQEHVKSLEKENELLSVSLSQEKSKPAPQPDTKALDQARQELAQANNKLADQSKQLDALASEKSSLEARLKQASTQKIDTTEADRAKEQLAEANRKLADQAKELNHLSSEKLALEQRIKQTPPPKVDTKAVEQAEKALAEANRKVNDQAKQLAALSQDKAALEARLKQSAPEDRASSKQIKQLEKERDELEKKLETANKETSGKKAKASTARVENQEHQLASMRAQLQAYEARSAPYSPEELALLKTSPVQLAAAEAQQPKKSTQELPPGAKDLLAEAQRAFSAHDLDKAEAKYIELVRQADQNVYLLANLAAIQLELNKLGEAEEHIKQALAVAPEDAYSLSVLGRLKFKQQKYDEAVQALSHAAQIDPQNPEIQNYLGISLSQKGLRGPAEAALRKAVQLQPNYGEAHHNLAVAYATQKPPLLELAKWHYQKALAAKSPRSAELEKILQAKKEE